MTASRGHDLAARLTLTLRRRRSSQAVNGTVGAVLLVLGAGLATH